MIEFPWVEPGEPVPVSATTYVAYRRCAESAAARLRGLYGPDSKTAFRGGLAHRVFARHLSDGPIPSDGFEMACRQEIGSSNMNMKVVDLKLKPSDIRNLIEEVGHLYERFKTLSSDGFEAAEVSLEHEPSEGVVLKGSVDAVFDDGPAGVRLVDWKTGQLGSSSDQMAFYTLLWTLDRNELPGSVEAMSVKTGERSASVPSLAEVTQTARNVADLVTSVRRASLAQDGLERTAGPWCRYCPVLDSCTEGAAAVHVLGN